MKFRHNAVVVLLALLPALSWGNDYPTQARVEFVFGCMNNLGAQNYDNMYACVCTLDKLASEVEYDKFVELSSLSTLVFTPGEKGGAFREIPDARKNLSSFAKRQKALLASCRVAAAPKSE